MSKPASQMREWWVKVFELVAARRTDDAKLMMTVLPRLRRLRYEEISRLNQIRAKLEVATDEDDDRVFLLTLVDRLDDELIEVEYCFLDPNKTDGYVPSWVFLG